MRDNVVSTPHTLEADDHIRSVVHPVVYRHSMRVFLLGGHVADGDGHVDLDTEALLVAALFHDSGTADLYNGGARFEVEGPTPLPISSLGGGGRTSG